MARHGAEWHFFGDRWVEQHLFGEGFLRPPSKEIDREKQQRVGLTGYQLAEALFNLQDIEASRAFIPALQAVNWSHALESSRLRGSLSAEVSSYVLLPHEGPSEMITT
jgi:hypothetical protein